MQKILIFFEDPDKYPSIEMYPHSKLQLQYSNLSAPALQYHYKQYEVSGFNVTAQLPSPVRLYCIFFDHYGIVTNIVLKSCRD